MIAAWRQDQSGENSGRTDSQPMNTHIVPIVQMDGLLVLRHRDRRFSPVDRVSVDASLSSFVNL